MAGDPGPVTATRAAGEIYEALDICYPRLCDWVDFYTVTTVSQSPGVVDMPGEGATAVAEVLDDHRRPVC